MKRFLELTVVSNGDERPIQVGVEQIQLIEPGTFGARIWIYGRKTPLTVTETFQQIYVALGMHKQ